MKKLYLVLLLLLSVNIYSKDYYKAKILKVNGEVIECFSELPSNNPFNKSVTYKIDLDSKKKIKLKNDEIKSMIITSEEGNNYYFERTGFRQIYKNLGGKVKERISKPKYWRLMIYHNDAIQVFYGAETYSFNKNNELISKASSNGGLIAIIPVLFKRPGEDVPTYITELLRGAIESGKNKAFRNTTILYFEGESEFISRIESKEFVAYGFIELAEAYGEYKKEGSQ